MNCLAERVEDRRQRVRFHPFEHAASLPGRGNADVVSVGISIRGITQEDTDKLKPGGLVRRRGVILFRPSDADVSPWVADLQLIRNLGCHARKDATASERRA